MAGGATFRVAAAALYAPPTVQTAEDLAPLLGRSADWIRSRTGVAERRVSEVSMAVLGARAARAALGDGPPPDLIINASLTPIQLIPDSSVFIQRELGFTGIPSFSIHATCLSFLVAFHQAIHLLTSTIHRRVLIISAEQGTRCRDVSQPESAALIGDGAAAVLLEAPGSNPGELLAWEMRTWPEGAHLAEIRGGGTRLHPNDERTVPRDNLFQMDGRELVRLAARGTAEVVRTTLRKARVKAGEIGVVVPHQPSAPALDLLARIGFERNRIVDIVGTYGNCIAASMPMALAHARAAGMLRPGSLVMLVGTSAGVSAAAAVIRWQHE